MSTEIPYEKCNRIFKIKLGKNSIYEKKSFFLTFKKEIKTKIPNDLIQIVKI